MPVYLLDVVDESIASERTGYGIFIIVVVATILVEAVVMLLMKYNRFKKALLDSFLVNVVSLGAGFVIGQFADDILRSYRVMDLLILCAITILIEWGILYLLNRKKPFLKKLGTAVVMNVVSYLLFYLFIHIR